MLFVRLSTGLLFISALFFMAACGQCAEQTNTLDQQIAERTKQYQESLRKRAASLSPSLQAKIDSQARQTVSEGMEKWKKGEVSLRIALPHWADARDTARFLARSLPFSGFPGSSFVFGSDAPTAAVVVVSVQHIVKLFTVPITDFAVNLSFVKLPRESGNVLSYFLLIVRSVVQRR
jgi:hypothetical protein